MTTSPASPGAAPGLTTGRGRARVTLVVPTFREAENIPDLVRRLDAVRRRAGLELELLLMDDDSRDGSEAVVSALGLPWVRMVVRKSDRGLSQAVLDGIRRAAGDVVVVMDADLSHPPERIPDLLAALDRGADAAVGSRFVAGGSTDAAWGLFRTVNSRVATLLARPLTPLRDPMSGFFALRRSTVASATALDPIGYKIGLELLVKCRCRKVVEVPIHFADRRRGESKLSVREQIAYLRHLRRLYVHVFGRWSHLAQFLAVGASGWAVNVALLTLLLRCRASKHAAVALAIALSMLWNFGLNRRLSSSRAGGERALPQLARYVAVSAVGAVASDLTTALLWDVFRVKQVAASAGVLAGAVLNLAGNCLVVFRTARGRGVGPTLGEATS